ncbi:MAG: T9SS type A sorting domain-containing protein, partial [Bacteroidales bacterium]|nr:T9SS type A sorting domain-containing protein [Bacteroidales bacterium]
SLIEFSTYFINEDHTIPVVSIAANDVTNLLNGNANLNPIGSIEYFNHDGERTASSYGVYDKHGQDSWANPQRSIDFIARDEMGYKHALIEKLLPLSDRNEFQRIILRACGDDNYPGIDSSAHMRDIWIQNLAEKEGLNLDVRKGTRIVMYANGQFWGVYSIREKVNDHDYMNYYYGQDRFNLQFLMFWGNLWAEYGGDRALNEWASFKNYMLSSNVNDPVVFENIKNQYDYTSLIDYIIINSFVVCSDWLNWNVGWWRGLNPEGGHLKWGYILWDEDATFGHYINYTGIPGQIPTVPPCFPEFLGPYSDPEQHIEIFNKLRENPEVEQYYISRYLDLKNTVFVKEDLLVYFDSLRSVIDPEMARHSTRWGGDYMQWRTNTNKVRNFIIARCDYLESGLMTCYNLTGPYNFTVNLNAEGSGNGSVKVNTIFPDQYPWSGVYYGGVDMRLEAIPTNNYFVFDHWELTNHSGQISDLTAPIISFNLTNWESVTAHFKPIAYADSLVINEINYKSSASFDSEDWLVLYNPHETPLDITNWVFKDDDDAHEFVFPTNTIIPAKGYLVLCRDTVMFKSVYPAVLNKIGNIDFGFSSNGEILRLFNSSGALIDTVHYGVSAPWPSEANGGGSTLELINPSYDNALAASWMASPPAGTPGAMNSLISDISEYDLSGQTLKLRVQPNPAQTYTMIEVISDQSINQAKICLFDAFGKEVFSLDNIQSDAIRIPRNNLPSGMYLFRITNNEGKTIGAGKILFN